MDNQERRRQYEKQVLDCLRSLLYLYSRGRDQIATDCPHALAEIDTDFDANLSPQRSAIFATLTIIGDIVETLEPEQRLLMLRQVQQLDVQQFEADLNDLMAGKDPFPDDARAESIRSREPSSLNDLRSRLCVQYW